jgi:hypothetical protein
MRLPVQTISRALASYVSLLSGDAPFDRFADGDRTALSAEQEDGLRLFRRKGSYTACHVGPTFTDDMFHNTGVAWRAAEGGDGSGSFADEGRFLVTGRIEDRGAFKTPTLREVVRTAPYVHDGSFATLDDVVEFYDRGGRSNPHLDAELRPIGSRRRRRRRSSPSCTRSRGGYASEWRLDVMSAPLETTPPGAWVQRSWRRLFTSAAGEMALPAGARGVAVASRFVRTEPQQFPHTTATCAVRRA